MILSFFEYCIVLKTTFGLDSKIIFKQFSNEDSLTFEILVTFELLPISFNDKIVSLYNCFIL